jgi:Flp pilus assembly protein TadG
MHRLGRTLLKRIADAHRDDSGQMAILFILTLLVVFIFFALAFDAGLWYFDHRTAQNQSEAAALAAAQELPNTDTSGATAAADEWLAKNGSGADERYCLDYSDRSGDGKFDTARVCVRREAPGIFAALSGIKSVWVSAAATATVGRVTMSNVMPWGIVPPDPTCTADAGRECQNPFNTDGVMADCGTFEECPWGLDMNRLYPFKLSSHITPGNFGAIAACGNGATNYRDCITGQTVSGFWEEDETVQVDPQTGNLGQNTNVALADRYAQDGADGTYDCDITSKPDAVTGLDPVGKALAQDKFVDNPQPGCDSRLVVVPVIDHFPQGHSDSIQVLGVATFGIAKWDRNSPWGDALGTVDSECGQASGSGFDCGMVWGYLMKDAQPPDFLLEQIGSDNPLAPLLIALVD